MLLNILNNNNKRHNNKKSLSYHFISKTFCKAFIRSIITYNNNYYYHY